MLVHDFKEAKKIKAKAVITVSKGSIECKEGKITYIEKNCSTYGFTSEYKEAKDTIRDIEHREYAIKALGFDKEEYKNEYIFFEARDISNKLSSAIAPHNLTIGDIVPYRIFHKATVSAKDYAKVGTAPEVKIKRIGLQ